MEPHKKQTTLEPPALARSNKNTDKEGGIMVGGG